MKAFRGTIFKVLMVFGIVAGVILGMYGMKMIKSIVDLGDSTNLFYMDAKVEDVDNNNMIIKVSNEDVGESSLTFKEFNRDKFEVGSTIYVVCDKDGEAIMLKDDFSGTTNRGFILIFVGLVIGGVCILTSLNVILDRKDRKGYN